MEHRGEKSSKPASFSGHLRGADHTTGPDIPANTARATVPDVVPPLRPKRHKQSHAVRHIGKGKVPHSPKQLRTPSPSSQQLSEFPDKNSAQPERLTAETTEPRKSALKTRTPGASATLQPDARGATLSPTAGPSNWAGSGAPTPSTDHAEGGTAAPKAITTRTRSTAAPSAPRAAEQEARGLHPIGVVTPPVPSAGTFSPEVFAATFRGRSSEPSSPSPYHSSRRPTPPKIKEETLPSSAMSPELPGSASPNSDPVGQEQTFSEAVDNLGDGTKRRKPSVRFGHATILEITRDYMSALEGYRPLLFFILVLLAVLFVSVVGLTIVLSLHAHQPLYLKACPTQACNRAAHDMDRLLDSSTDPCDDFHAHVCRRLNHRGARFLEGVADKMLAYINESLSDSGHVYQGSPRLKHIAQFYQLCQRFFAIEIPSNDVFGSIPRFEEVLGPASNLSTVLKRLIYLSLSRGVRNIIDIHLVRTEGTVQLRVNQGISLARKCHSEVPPTLASYLGALARSMGPVGGMPFTLSDILETDAFMERHRSRKDVEGRFNVSVLDSLIVSMKRDFWMAEFNSHIPRPHQLTENSVIGIDDLGSVRAVLRFVEGLPDYGAVYIYFQFILEALRFDYLRLFNAHGKKAVVKACLQATRSVIRDAASDIVNNLLYKQVSDPVARELFTQVLGSLRLTSDFAWMGEDIKHQAEKTLHGVALYDYNFSLSASRAVSAGGDEHEAQLNVVRDLHKFPALFLELKSQLQASFLVDPPRVEVEEHVDLFLFGTGVAYDGITNTVRIPAALRREPVLYASDVPLEYSLGTLGALVAKELVRAEVSSSKQGIRTERERVALFKYRQCIEVLARTVLNVNVNRSDGDRVPEYYYWMQGARTAYNALNAAYVRRRHAVNWDVFWKSAQRTFFKRFCLLSCNADQERGEQNTSKLHCFLPLLNMKEFSEAFECHGQPHVRSRNYCRLE